MRVLIAATLALCSTAYLPAQIQPGPDGSGMCSAESKGLPDFYYEAVLARIQPPDRKDWLVGITLTGERKVVLATTGDKFELWTDTFDLPQKTVRGFLKDLDQSCRLPADPADAAELIKVRWESKELSPAQFATVHQDFIRAAAGYVSKAQKRYHSMLERRMVRVYLDASYFGIIYDNHNEHIELRVWDDVDKPTDPMVSWAHSVLGLAEDKFHRSFGRKASE